MRALILTDIHANAVALEAVLATPEARDCDTVVSLGDQVNYGPEPARALALLKRLEAEGRPTTLLMGNHEERLLRIDAPEFQTYNWNLLRWTFEQVPDMNLKLPRELILGEALFTHAVPGNLNRLVMPETVASELDGLPEGVRWLVSGHNHCRWRVERRGRIAFNPGSLGALEGEGGCEAPFAVMTESGGRADFHRYTARYDGDAAARAYVRSGCWKIAPELARASLQTMLAGGACPPLRWIQHVRETARRMNGDANSREAWREADKTWDWLEPVDSERYWSALAKRYGA